jgi:Na+-transporting NADH:ubiquinone oxidoreductase subunit C
MNKQSNLYTIVYIIVLVVVVGAALALTAMSLRDRQQANADADKMRQILASVHISTNQSDIQDEFNRYVTAQLIVNESGDVVSSDGAFNVNVSEQVKLDASQRQLPVYECTLAPDDVKYIIPLYGAGLWGPIWGYVAFNSDGATVYGAYFAHQGETPGLGAEIEKPHFSDQFNGKTVFHGDQFLPIAVVKAGQKPLNGEDYVDGISGGTITSKGVSAMLNNSLTPYAAFLSNLRSK